jgi:pyruvate/2-oxoglutarate dehydrogenase complex dihydrolipoamide acyltransferase (E2) component
VTDVHIPKLGMSAVEVDITAILVTIGDRVSSDTPIIEVDSEKVTLAIEAGVSGVVAEILVRQGDVCNVGDVIARIREEQAT